MLSVLIIDSKVLDHYSRYDYFFGHFENSGEVAVCVWNKQSFEDDVASMIPQLMDTVRNVPEWNAYIICEPHNSMELLQSDFENKTQYSVNPYERGNHKDYDPEKDRLLKLLYFLGGRGEDRVDYIQQYQFRAARPTGIFLITPRIFKNIEQQKNFLLSEIRGDDFDVLGSPARVLSGEIDITRNYSEFWERYEYPANCRFMVYDFPEETHQTYMESWFPFWITVISVTKNRFSNAHLEPYKLHLISVDINDENFEEYINKFYTMLLENKNINQYLIEKENAQELEERKSTDITVTDACIPVYVNFPHVNVRDLYASDDNIGLVKDKPVLDEEDWRSQMKRTKEAIGKFFKSIARGKSEAVDFVHENLEAELPKLRGRTITKYDVEELSEAMNNDELSMIELNLGYNGSRAEFEKKQQKASRIVQTYMKRRMFCKVAVGIILACMLIYFIGFIPYVINSAIHSISSFFIAIVVSVAALLVPLICGIVTLAVLKRNMKKLIGLYNGIVSSGYMEVQESADRQSEYLTYLLDYMEKYQIYSFAAGNNAHIQRVNELLTANAVLDDAIEACSTLALLRGVSPTRIVDRYIENTIESEPKARVYLYEENKDGRMDLNSSKDILEAPFNFTDRLVINCEELYECGAYNDKPDTEEPDEWKEDEE